MNKVNLVTSINGKIVRHGQDKISVFDNSLLYAEGLFETCLGIGENVLFLKEHIERLYKGAKVTGFSVPANRAVLKNWIRKTTLTHPAFITKIRITVTAGESKRWTGKQGESQVIISVAPHEIPTKPFKLHLSDLRVDQDSIFRRIKTISYAIHASALRQAHKNHCDDALLLNEKDKIAEVTSANIFWVNKNKIYTPPLSSGCLEGITRKLIISEADKLGFRVIEKNITLEKLLDADEVFISSSLKLVVGVSIIKSTRKNFNIKTGPITGKISKHFYKLAGF